MKVSHVTRLSTVGFLALAVACGPVGASERHLDSHEHGVSTLKIAQDGNQMQFELEAPGNDIVGFEHAGKNDGEKKAIESSLELLQNPTALFAMPDAAGCEVQEVEAEFETEGEHAGFHVTWSITCKNVVAATSLNIGYFDAFEKVEEVEVEVLGNGSQSAYEVERGTKILDLSGVISG